MRITKFGHASVRLEHDGTALMLDPAMFTDPEALDGVAAILITHEHPDHYSPDLLRRSDAPIFTIDAVAQRIRDEAPDIAERVTVVTPGQQLDLGIPVTVVGEKHAVIQPDLPRYFNSGYLVDLGGTTVYHPGDSFEVPEAHVDVLLTPSSAPWLKASEAIDFVRAVGAPRNLAIHDRVYTDFGHRVLQVQMDALLPATGQSYERIADGTDLAI